MTIEDKINFISTSKHGKKWGHTPKKLSGVTDYRLNAIIRMIVQKLLVESEIIANAYISGMKR